MKQLKLLPNISEHDKRTIEQVINLKKSVDDMIDQRNRFENIRQRTPTTSLEYFKQTASALQMSAEEVQLHIIKGLEDSIQNIDKEIVATILVIEGKIKS
jgi:hypothetical protein